MVGGVEPSESHGAGCGFHDGFLAVTGGVYEPASPVKAVKLAGLLNSSAEFGSGCPNGSNCAAGCKLGLGAGKSDAAEFSAGWLSPINVRKRSIAAACSGFTLVTGCAGPKSLAQMEFAFWPNGEFCGALKKTPEFFGESGSMPGFGCENKSRSFGCPNRFAPSCENIFAPLNALLAEAIAAFSCRFKYRSSSDRFLSRSGRPKIFSGVSTPMISSGVINVQFRRSFKVFCHAEFNCGIGIGMPGLELKSGVELSNACGRLSGDTCGPAPKPSSAGLEKMMGSPDCWAEAEKAKADATAVKATAARKLKLDGIKSIFRFSTLNQ